MRFTQDGHFVVSPYCVTLQAVEVISGKKTTENATVCIHTPELLPVAMKLRDEKIKKTRKFNNNPDSLDELKVSSVMHYVLEYPEQVEVLQNASDFARVVEPVKAISEKQNK